MNEANVALNERLSDHAAISVDCQSHSQLCQPQRNEALDLSASHQTGWAGFQG